MLFLDTPGKMRMRGRRPDEVTICSPDQAELERIAHSDTLPWFRVRRARIVLGMAAGRRREILAAELNCDQSTIWRTCQRYQRLGLKDFLTDQRQGHSGPDLQIGVRLLPRPLPAVPSTALTSGLPQEEGYGFTTFR
jgi:hypothetical protein